MTDELGSIEARLRRGDLSVKPALREILRATCDISNSRAPRLWAFVATHSDVSAFAEVIPMLSRPEATRRVATSLGLTLSPRAVPLLLELQERFDDSELDPYISIALEVIIGRPHGTEIDVTSKHIRNEIEKATVPLNGGHYYYHGQPVFPGDITKELVAEAVVAFHERKDIAIVYEGDLLRAFSGLEPPVDRLQAVDDQRLKAIFAYVKRIAGLQWKRGWKYYWGRPLDGPP